MARVQLELPEHFDFTTELPVRITDINYGQHLGNDALLAFLHEARVRFLRSRGLSETDVGGCGLIMVDAVVVYKAQAAYGVALVVEVAVQALEKLGCDLVYRVTNPATGAEVARAKTTLVCFDYARGKPVRCPEKFRAALGTVRA
ncbi:MAG: thioesterase family protein [Kiritimatiellaeota bacterium]|nr:thioesterase family protein [Kiritimatiellota bacterium]